MNYVGRSTSDEADGGARRHDTFSVPWPRTILIHDAHVPDLVTHGGDHDRISAPRDTTPYAMIAIRVCVYVPSAIPLRDLLCSTYPVLSSLLMWNPVRCCKHLYYEYPPFCHRIRILASVHCTLKISTEDASPMLSAFLSNAKGIVSST